MKVLLKVILTIILALASYFAGNISPATIIARLKGHDIRKEGSGNPGTTNTLRVLGKKAALAVFLIDILKGFIMVLIGKAVSPICGMLCATAVIVGHMWPIIYGFKGGKGVAATLGVLLALDWRVGLIGLLIAAAALLITKRMSVGSLLGAISLPFSSLIFLKAFDSPLVRSDIFPLWCIIPALLIIFGHRANIKRLIKGEEPPLF